MSEDRQKRIREILWNIKRKKEFPKLEALLALNLNPNSYSFLSFEDSDAFKLEKRRYSDVYNTSEDLYYHCETTDTHPVEEIFKALQI